MRRSLLEVVHSVNCRLDLEMRLLIPIALEMAMIEIARWSNIVVFGGARLERIMPDSLSSLASKCEAASLANILRKVMLSWVIRP